MHWKGVSASDEDYERTCTQLLTQFKTLKLLGSDHTTITASTPQLPWKISKISSNRGYEAPDKGT